MEDRAEEARRAAKRAAAWASYLGVVAAGKRMCEAGQGSREEAEPTRQRQKRRRKAEAAAAGAVLEPDEA